MTFFMKNTLNVFWMIWQCFLDVLGKPISNILMLSGSYYVFIRLTIFLSAYCIFLILQINYFVSATPGGAEHQI